MDYLAKDLQPGVTYAIQVRSVSGTDVSEWSPVFQVLTSSDTTIPNNVSGLVGVIYGFAFKLSWDPVTTNTSGKTIRDLKDYQIAIFNGTDTVYRYSTTTSFAYTFDMNTQDFGTAFPVLTFTVKARDTTNNISPVGASVTLSNPVPANVTGVTATPNAGSITVAWNAVADTDISYYNVYASASSSFTPGPSNLVFSAKAYTFIYITSSSAPVYFKVTAVDIFGQESGTPTPVTTSPTAYPNTDHDTFTFTYSGVVALLTGHQRLYFESPYNVVSVRASVGTAPTGSSLKIDVLKNGTTLWNVTPANKPAIAISGFTSGAVTNMDTVALTAGDYLTVDVTQIGSTIAGSDLVVTIRVAA